MTVLRSGSASDVGRVRAVNEDLALATGPLYGVADGMGGHAGGDVAAQIAVKTVEEAFARQPTVQGLLDAVQDANLAVWERGREDADLRGMGTTLTAATLISGAPGDGDRLVLVNVGDSRAYRFRDGELEQLTNDHSVAEELVARGELTPEEAVSHPHRHILTRVLGVAPAVEVDAWELIPRVGDRYLLCSDGLSNEVTATLITRILGSAQGPDLVAEELVRTANEKGGNDNITVVVLDIASDDDPAEIDAVSEQTTGLGGSANESPPVPLTRSAKQAGSSRRGAGTLALERAPASGLATSEGDSTGSRVGTGGLRPDAASEQAYDVSDRRRRVGAVDKSPRVLTVRLVVFLILVLAVLAGAWGLVRWYLDNSYFLTIHNGEVVVEQGKPGGFLWFDPKVIDRTGVTTSEVPANQVSGLKQGTFTASSPAAARALVRRMVVTQCDYDQGVPGVTSTTTPSSNMPVIARCPTVPTPTVTPPPTTSTTASAASTTTTAPGATTTTTPGATTTAANGGTG